MKADTERTEDLERRIRMFLADIQIALSRAPENEPMKRRILDGLRAVAESPELRDVLASE